MDRSLVERDRDSAKVCNGAADQRSGYRISCVGEIGGGSVVTQWMKNSALGKTREAELRLDPSTAQFAWLLEESLALAIMIRASQ
jgi:hypothetical protein